MKLTSIPQIYRNANRWREILAVLSKHGLADLLGRLDLWGIAEMMMFYDALGGRNHNQQWHRYQHFVDLSHALDSDTAMLVGRCTAPRSELLRIEGDEPVSMRGEKDLYVVLYRYLLPVKPVEEEDDKS